MGPLVSHLLAVGEFGFKPLYLRTHKLYLLVSTFI